MNNKNIIIAELCTRLQQFTPSTTDDVDVEGTRKAIRTGLALFELLEEYDDLVVSYVNEAYIHIGSLSGGFITDLVRIFADLDYQVAVCANSSGVRGVLLRSRKNN